MAVVELSEREMAMVRRSMLLMTGKPYPDHDGFDDIYDLQRSVFIKMEDELIQAQAGNPWALFESSGPIPIESLKAQYPRFFTDDADANT